MKSVVYNAFCIVCNWRYAPFNERDERFESLQFIRENDLSITVNDKTHKAEYLHDDDISVPIRIMIDKNGEDSSDDWTFSSVIKELDWAGINRFWPKEWFYDGEGNPAKEITIHYAENIDIVLQIVKPSDKIMKSSFADVIINQDKDIITGYDKSIQIVEDAMKSEDVEMFKNKNKTKIANPETQTKENVVKVSDEPQQVATEESTGVEQQLADIAKEEVIVTKKKNRLLMIKRIGIAAVAITAGVLIGRLIVKIASKEPAVEAN